MLIPCFPSPRRHIVRVCALSALLMAVTPASWAQATRIESRTTGITSTTKRMISYRDQQHSWQTSDGAIHLMVNEGTVPANDSLTLYSSFDAGATWVPMFSLPHTNGFSTSDGMLTSTGPDSALLQLVYGTAQNTGNIVYATATYNSATQSWTLTSTQTAFSSNAITGSDPAFDVDSVGNLWCGFTAQNLATGDYQIEMLFRAANTTEWIKTGLIFGSTDTSTQHAARPVPFSNGIGMIYQSDQTMYWAYRLSDWATDAPWVSSELYAGLPPEQADPYDTHFSVVADAAQNLFLAFAGNSQLQYMKYTSSTGSWGPAQALTTTKASAAYMKAIVAGGNVILMTNDMSSVEVFQSTDDGDTFKLTQVLVHPAPPKGSPLNYGNPRIEAPSYPLSPIPVWQQFYYGSTQGLLYFEVPVL
jgi:hypothetical protein